MEENEIEIDLSSVKINSDINIHSEIGELLSNKRFLKYIKEYLKIYLEELVNSSIKEEEKEKLIKDFENNFLFIFNLEKGDNIDVEKMASSLVEFFKSKKNLVGFLDYMGTKWFLNKDKYKLEYNKFLRVGDYLYTRIEKYNGLSKKVGEDLLKESLKKKVGDVLEDEEYKNISFKLLEAGYPIMVEGYTIVEADFEKTFIIAGEKVIQVKFIDKNKIHQKAYIDYTGKIYKSYNGLEIEQIDYSFTIKGINFFKFADSNNNKNLTAIKTSNNRYIELEFDDVRRKELTHNGEVLEYILTSSNIVNKEASIENYNRLYEVNDGEIEGLQLLDILNFINPLEAHSFLEKKEYYSEFFLSEIKKPKIIDGITFLELTTINKDGDKNNIVLTSNGDILINGEKYISKIYDLENLLGYSFLGFGEINGFKSGYLDKNCKPIKIPYDKIIKKERSKAKKNNEDLRKDSLEALKNNKENSKFDIDIEEISKLELTKAFDLKEKVGNDNIFSIKKSGIPHNGEEYYILNKDKNLVISEKNLKEHFSNYEAFYDVIENVKIPIDEGTLSIDGKEIIKLHVNFTYSGEIRFFTPGNRKILDGNVIIDELEKTEKGQEVVESLFIKLGEIRAIIGK